MHRHVVNGLAAQVPAAHAVPGVVDGELGLEKLIEGANRGWREGPHVRIALQGDQPCEAPDTRPLDLAGDIADVDLAVMNLEELLLCNLCMAADLAGDLIDEERKAKHWR